MTTPFIEASQGAVSARQRDEALKQALGYLGIAQQQQAEQSQGLTDSDAAAAAIARAFQPDKPAAPPPAPMGPPPGPPPMGAGAMPQGTPPNAMAPGQPSAPMQPPMPPMPQPPPIPQPQGAGSMQPVNLNLRGQFPQDQARDMLQAILKDIPGGGAPSAPPQGFKLSSAAPPSLGGVPPGAPPKPDVIPQKMLSVPEFLAKLDQDPALKNNPRVKRLAMQQAFPLIQQQNQQEYKQAQLELQSQDRIIRFEKEERLRLEQQLRDMREGKKIDIMEGRLDLAEKTAAARAGGGGGFSQEYDKLSPRQQATVDFYATQQIGGDSTWRVGLGRTAGGSSLIKAVEERVPEVATELGLSAADVGTNRAKRVANQAALTQVTKDITTIKPFAAMLDQNADILKGLAKKIIKTQSPLANRPLNWLQNNAAGDPDVAEFLAQMKIVQTEAARVIQNPRLVGQLTDEAQREMQAIVNGEMSLGATDRVLDRIINDSQRRVGQMEKQQKTLEGSIKEQMTGPGKETSAEAGGVREFKTEAEAAAAKLPKGTKVKINGVSGTWQ